MNLLISFRSEILKTKLTASWYLTLLAAAIIPTIILIDFNADGFLPENLKDPWNIMFVEGAKGIGAMIFPMYVILVCTLLPQIEFRNNTWKQVFASPQKLLHVYFAKFMNVQILIIIFLIAFNVFMTITAVSIHHIDPSVGVGKPEPNLSAILTISLKLYLSILAISALQFWLGLRYKNFIAPVAIGFMCWVIGCITMLQMHTSQASLFPYTYPIISMFPVFEPRWAVALAGSFSYAVIFLVLGFADFKRRMGRG
jgi:lantibiotic transport system permease protein